MASILHQFILVGIETDPTRYLGEHASRPVLLEQAAAEQVLAHLADDLTAMFPGISHCSLGMAGALYDQTQVLRPGLQVYTALEHLQHASNPGAEFKPRMLSVGASGGRMPMQELQPFEDITLGLLQILPLLVSGPASSLDKLVNGMEHRSPKKVQLSAHSARVLEAQFHVSITHARFMTLTDLSAMLRLRLEQYGFLPLWELLDAAVNPGTSKLEVTSRSGHKFKCLDGVVHSYFETFDWWAQRGGGRELPAGQHRLQAAYAEWTREYRRYLAMLTAHGVHVSQHLPGLEDAELTDSFLLEESTNIPRPTAAPVTAHGADDLGTIAVTVVSGPRQMNLYPIRPSGLDDLHQFIRDEGYGGDIAYPGRLCYDEKSRQLIAEPLPY